MLKLAKIVVVSMMLALLLSGSCLAADPYDVSGIDLRDFLNTFRLEQVPVWDKYSPRESIVDGSNTRHVFSLDRKGEANVVLWTDNASGKIQLIIVHNDYTGTFLFEWTEVVAQLYGPPSVIEDGGNYYNPAVMRMWEGRRGAALNGNVSIAPRVQMTELQLSVKK